MRLLRCTDDGFTLTKDFRPHEEWPEYAILSHRWGLDDEEVTHADLVNNVGETKKRVWTVPFDRNPCFTGRDDELKAIRQMLVVKDRTARVAITGLGGVGKTNIVLELLYRMRAEYKHCSFIWIPATSEESLSQAYLAAAEKLGIPGWNDPKADVKKLVQAYLSNENAGQWVLVFDNADDRTLWLERPANDPHSSRLIDHLPKSSRGSIIFTTRDTGLAVQLASPNNVNVSDVGEAGGKKLLRKYIHEQELLQNEEDTAALLKWLTYLPLAIVQAAMYINEIGLDLSEYLSLLNDQEEGAIKLLSEDFLDYGRYSDGKNPIATTWLVSFEQIRKRDSLASELLSFMACIDAKDIPRSLLAQDLGRKKEADAIGTLKAFSFISQNRASSTFTMHRLVHLAMRNWLQKEQLLLPWTQKAVTRLANVLQNPDYHHRDIWRSHMSHAQYALTMSRAQGLHVAQAPPHMSTHARCLHGLLVSSKMPISSEPMPTKPSHTTGLRESDGTDRQRLLSAYGTCLYYDGRYRDAEAARKEVMETSKAKLGADHPDTLTSINNLASTYRNQGRWEEAKKLFVQVMETPSTYRNQGRWEEAEKLFVQVMETLYARYHDRGEIYQ
ncbi:kinesin light chain [Grosmannia clavigera kw1407]|uniref:Kinesin light chain n=1 Tax=Grosmannia clavigera (strain kw1407 / UAMH 11150) TaxID=655863 RepID=F0XGB7_GROCL|nr:kinesin light chain [Grosmannia clavigera kw1407]EFX02656.1 kinesin light chain [Grosmannia clavigera kw1407]